MASVAAVLLAAGESARMGQPKALLPWCGSTLLEYQASSLSSAGIGRIIVVLGHRSKELVPLLEDRPALEWVYNRDYLIGKTTSLKGRTPGPRRPFGGGHPGPQRGPASLRSRDRHGDRRAPAPQESHHCALLPREGGASHPPLHIAPSRADGHHRGVPGPQDRGPQARG